MLDPTLAPRLLEMLEAIGFAALPLVNRPRGRPPIDDADPQEVLSHPRRRRIYELIEERPGIPAIDIQQTLGFASGVLENHLDRLMRAGLLERRRSGRFVRLYTVGEAPPENDPRLLPDSTKKVARAVLRVPGRTSAEIAMDVDLSRVSVNGHLRTLAYLGLVRPVPDGWRTRHHPTDLLVESTPDW